MNPQEALAEPPANNELDPRRVHDLLAAISTTARITRAAAEPLLMLRQGARHIAAALGWEDAGLLLVAPSGKPSDHGHYVVAGDVAAGVEQCARGPEGECLIEKAVSIGSLVVTAASDRPVSDGDIGVREPGPRHMILQPVPPIPGMAHAVLRFISDDGSQSLTGVSHAERDALEACATLLGLACRLHDAQDGAIAGGDRRRVHSLGGTALLGVGSTGDITTWSEEARRMFGGESIDMIGQSFGHRLLAAGSRRHFETLVAALTSPGPSEIVTGRTELTALRHDGAEFPVELEFWERRVDDSPRLYVSITDITERKAHELELEDLALRDPLTGVANRAALRREITSMLADTSSEIAVLFIDFDKFKHVNDTLGHETGDRLLEAVAARLKSAVRPRDLVARLAGDEFVLVARCDGDPHLGRRLAERVHDAVATPVNLAGEFVKVGLSIGVSHSRPGQRDATSLLAEADSAMYTAKRHKLGIAYFEADARSIESRVSAAVD